MYSIGEYNIFKKSIGKGGFSKIYRGIDKNKKEVAIKIIKKNKIDEKIILREISLLKKVSHKNIISLIDVYVSKNKYYIILEYCHNGDLKQFTKNKKLNELEINQFMIQIKDGLEYLYNHNIIHRDLKPHNILVTKDNILKISDFGFAKYYTEQLSQTICGSPLYMAPEILTYKKYTDLADLWSVGIIMYELFFNKPPVTGKNIYNLVNNIKLNNFKITKKQLKSENINISENALDLLHQLLQKESIKRIKWNKFFNHPWFENNIINNNIETNNIETNNIIINNNNNDIKDNIEDNLQDMMFNMDDDITKNNNDNNYNTKSMELNDDYNDNNNENNDNNNENNDNNNENNDKDNNYNILYSYNNITVNDDYLNIESSLIESLDIDNYIIISSSPSEYTQTIKIPKKKKYNIKNLYKSLKSSLSFIFSPKSI